MAPRPEQAQLILQAARLGDDLRELTAVIAQKDPGRRVRVTARWLQRWPCDSRSSELLRRWAGVLGPLDIYFPATPHSRVGRPAGTGRVQSEFMRTDLGGQQVDFSDPMIVFAAAFVVIVLAAAVLTLDTRRARRTG
jgi:hypothetical protein